MDPSRRPYGQDDPIRIDTLGQGGHGGEQGQYGYGGYEPPTTGTQRPGLQSPADASLTQEDMRLLRECNRESFYRRCLPLIIAGNALTHTWYSRSPEPVSSSKRWAGYTFVTVAMWITGKLSYRRTCEEQIITSGYSSRLVDSIRKRRGIVTTESELSGDYYGDDQAVVFDWKEDDRQSVMKDDKTRSLQQFGDGPTGDKPFYGDDDMSAESRKEFTSYDLLRQQNRARAVPAEPTRPRPYEDKRF